MARALPKPQHDERATEAGVAVLPPDDRPLRLNQAGLDLIGQRLEDANRNNPDFAVQRDRLLGAVSMALAGLLHHLAPEIERVAAIGEWALRGVDLRTLSEAEDVVLEIVVRGDRRHFDFDRRVSRAVLADVQDAHVDHFLLQMSVLPLPLWRHGVAFRRAAGGDDGTRDVPLLTRE